MREGKSSSPRAGCARQTRGGDSGRARRRAAAPRPPRARRRARRRCPRRRAAARRGSSRPSRRADRDGRDSRAALSAAPRASERVAGGDDHESRFRERRPLREAPIAASFHRARGAVVNGRDSIGDGLDRESEHAAFHGAHLFRIDEPRLRGACIRGRLNRRADSHAIAGRRARRIRQRSNDGRDARQILPPQRSTSRQRERRRGGAGGDDAPSTRAGPARGPAPHFTQRRTGSSTPSPAPPAGRLARTSEARTRSRSTPPECRAPDGASPRRPPPRRPR